MAYLSLYRKYRSQTFSELIGQDHVVRTLQNSLKSGRIAHAYLFTGPRGTGKTSTARLLAKSLCCEKGASQEPCNECDICKSITDGSCIDVYEMDAASESGVDDVRETIVEVATYQPAVSRYKVFVIDEVHDLSSKAFDALLKTIEEPPAHVVFILATTEYSKVPPTIRSRCQKYEFHRASVANLVSRIQYVAEQEGFKVEPAALVAIAKMADGGYRDAMTLLEQAIITSDGPITTQQVYDQLGMVANETADELLEAMKAGDAAQVVHIVGELTRMGRDPGAIVDSLLYRLADLTRANFGVDQLDSKDAPQEAATHERAQRLGMDTITAIRSALAVTHRHIRSVSLPRLWLEAELLRISAVGTQPVEQPARAVQQAKPRPVQAKAVVETVQADPPVEDSAAKEAPLAEPPAEPQPEPAEAAPLSADASPQELWEHVLKGMPSKTAVAMKLSQSNALSMEGTVLTVELSKMHIDWINDKPQRMGFIVAEIHKATGKELQVKFVPKKGSKSSGDAPTVELPSEGHKLVELTREVFGG